MMIIMKANATPQQTETVIAQIKEMGLAVHLSQGVEATVIGAIVPLTSGIRAAML